MQTQPVEVDPCRGSILFEHPVDTITSDRLVQAAGAVVLDRPEQRGGAVASGAAVPGEFEVFIDRRQRRRGYTGVMSELFGQTNSTETIVEIRSTQRDANRATIRVGSRSSKGKPRVVATLTTRLIADLGLYVGQAWTAALAGQVEGGVGFDKAMRAAMNRLSRRAMSGRMLRDKLKTLGHETLVIDAVLERLAQLDLLDDEKFGRALVRDVMSRKPAGPALLKQKLYQKGIRGALADRLVAEATSDHDAQHDAAIAFALKKAASMLKLEPVAIERRLYGQLARRGFGPDTIRAAMEAVRRDLADERL